VKPKHLWKRWWALVVGVILSIASLRFASPSEWPLATSIFFLFAGFLYSYLFGQGEMVAKLNDLLASRPIETMPGSVALDRLRKRIYDARRAWNTRIALSAEHFPHAEELLKEWERDVRRAANRGLVLQDVWSEDWQTEAQARTNALKDVANYAGFVVPGPRPFINFVLLDFQEDDEPDEVWFGWPTTDTLALNEPCTRCSDRDVVALFRTVFSALTVGKTPLAPRPLPRAPGAK
jgi:hypothetical protein